MFIIPRFDLFKFIIESDLYTTPTTSTSQVMPTTNHPTTTPLINPSSPQQIKKKPKKDKSEDIVKKNAVNSMKKVLKSEVKQITGQ